MTRRDSITVTAESDRVSTEADRNAAAISVSRSLLDNLPVLDLDVLATISRFTDPLSQGGAPQLVVDGMEARNLGVTASAIESVRINSNPYTAEYPRWSRRRIEVITKSGTDRYHGTFNFLFRDYRFNARDPFAATRPEERRYNFEGSLLGPIGTGKRTSFLVTGQRQNDYLVSVVNAIGPRGPVNENVAAPQFNTYLTGRLNHGFSDRHAVFFQYNFQDRWTNNAGVGGLVLSEAGTQLRFREDEFLFNDRTVFSPRLLSQFRILVGRYWSPTKSNFDAAKAVVSDAFTGGGAQADQLRTEFHTAITWLMTQTVGGHSLKYGVNIPDWSRRGFSDRTNQIGTRSFGSLTDFTAARPYSILLQRGDPRTIFIEKNVGGFVQDDWQIRPGFSLSLGMRYDWQNYFGDANNIQPRFAIAWAPGRQRKWVIRAGAGIFYERSGPQPIWDKLRFDGVQLRRYLITPPQFGVDPDALPTAITTFDPAIRLPGIFQMSYGIERQLTAKSTIAVQGVFVRQYDQFRSRDANAPLPPAFGARPDTRFSQVRQIEAATHGKASYLEATWRGELAPKISGLVQYFLMKASGDVLGLTGFPAASYSPNEWGRVDEDRRHTVVAALSAKLHPWMNLGITMDLRSAPPFNVTTGRDENGDGLALDRPAGLARNTGSGPALLELNLRWSRDWRLRPSLKDKAPLATFAVDGFNVFNHTNPQNYLGALSSPLFGRAVASYPSRRLQFGFRWTCPLF